MEGEVEEVIEKRAEEEARKEDIDQEIWKAIFAKKPDKFEDLKELLPLIVVNAEAISKTPPTMQNLLGFALASAMTRKDEVDPESVVTKAVTLKETLKMLRDKDENDEFTKTLMREIEELKKRLDEKEKEEMRRMLGEVVESLEEKYKTLEGIVLQREREGSGEVKKGVTDELREKIEEIRGLKELMKEMASSFEGEKKSEEIDLAAAVKKLKELGYEVKGPHDLLNELSKRMDEIKEEAKREAMEELRIQEKREAMLVDLFSTISGAILDAMKGPASASGTSAEKIVERVREWKGQKQEI